MKITKTLLMLTTLSVAALTSAPAGAQQQQRPNIVIIWGDDIGQSNVSAYSRGLMGYQTPNIDRVASEGPASAVAIDPALAGVEEQPGVQGGQ